MSENAAFAQNKAADMKHLATGSAALEKKNYKTAIKHLTRASQSSHLSNVQIAKALLHRGMAYRRSGQHGLAIADLNNALWIGSLPAGDRQIASTERAQAYKAVGLNVGSTPKAQKNNAASGRNVHLSKNEPDTQTQSYHSDVTDIDQYNKSRRRAQNQAINGAPVDNSSDSPLSNVPGAISGFFSDLNPFSSGPKAARRPAQVAPAAATTATTTTSTAAAVTTASVKTVTPATAPATAPASPSVWRTRVTTTSNNGQARRTSERAEETSSAPAQDAISGFFRSINPFSQSQAQKAPTNTGQAATQSSTWQVASRSNSSNNTASGTVGQGKYRLQLASVRTETEAKTAWQNLTKRHGALLNGQNPEFKKTNIGNRGVFYRVQIGPFADKRQTLKLCNQLKSNGVSCFLVQ